MPKNLANFLKRKKFSIAIGSILLVCIGVLLYWVLFFYSTQGYRTANRSISFSSDIGSALRVFVLNQSQHNDPVKGCWYDAGDYIVFIQRNTQALVYLSMAYQYAEGEEVKKDLKKVIDQQLGCVEQMIAAGYKQFRDQDVHGVNLPPSWNERVYPQQTYFFRDGEGRDIYAMLSLVYANLGNEGLSRRMRDTARTLENMTVSENCCEEGPLSLREGEYEGLLDLADIKDVDATSLPDLWGIRFAALLNIEQEEERTIARVLTKVGDRFDSDTKVFDYIGGNYDIAGTIALERLYKKRFGSNEFSDLSSRLYAYLHGENEYAVNFTEYDDVYHPCHFFSACDLSGALINGPDEKGFDWQRSDVWRNTEVQLPGQAMYVLAMVLYTSL